LYGNREEKACGQAETNHLASEGINSTVAVMIFRDILGRATTSVSLPHSGISGWMIETKKEEENIKKLLYGSKAHSCDVWTCRRVFTLTSYIGGGGARAGVAICGNTV
jgi:hypothetical protein